MRSDAATVDAYIAEASEERRAALGLLRSLCLEGLPGFVECMRYGMPSYERGGVVEVAFAGQKQYVALYVLRRASLEANAGALAGLSVGKGCIRFRRPEQIDPVLVRALLDATLAATGPVC